MQTGNMVMLGRVLVDDEHPAVDVFFYFALMIAGLMGMAAYEWMRLIFPDLRGVRIALPLAALIGLSDVLDAVTGTSRWHAVLVAMSLGAQNSLTATESGVSTTMMTGNLGKVSTCFVKVCAEPSREQRVSLLREHAVYPLVVLSTILGAFNGALLRTVAGSTRYQFTPIAILQAVSLLADGVCSAPPQQQQSPPPSSLAKMLAAVSPASLSPSAPGFRRQRPRPLRMEAPRRGESSTAAILELDSAAEVAAEACQRDLASTRV